MKGMVGSVSTNRERDDLAARAWVAACAILISILMGPANSRASFTVVCSFCHVMHASQAGLESTPRAWLLNNSCLGCHTGTNIGPIPGGLTIPYVLTVGATTLANALAGGNFKFSGDNAHYGHNPLELGVAAVVSPPGWKDSGFAANGQVGDTPTWTSQLTCDGTWGCHGTHNAGGVFGSHHHNSGGQLTTPPLPTVGKSYRLLYQIQGYEDDDWQFETAIDKNIYYGVERGADSATDTTTMSYFCAECHGIFHSGAAKEGVVDGTFASPWIRHPVDISMPLTADSEYAAYNAYRTDAPVASSTVPATSTINVAASSGRIVMCLSCHQAHATPYYAIMRWDYRGSGSTWTNGCSYCHTVKN
jgi:hypothetical protein